MKVNRLNKVTSLRVSQKAQLVPIEYLKTFVFRAFWIFPSDISFLPKVKAHSYTLKESRDMITHFHLVHLGFSGEIKGFENDTDNNLLS